MQGQRTKAPYLLLVFCLLLCLATSQTALVPSGNPACNSCPTSSMMQIKSTPARRKTNATTLSSTHTVSKMPSQQHDCAVPCRSYVNGASATSEHVCLNANIGVCGGDSPCPQQYPRCKQIAGDCAVSCSSYVNGASATSEHVCLNANTGMCGGNSPCPQQYPRCKQIVGDCAVPCRSFVNGASATSEYVCLNAADRICGSDSPCPQQYPRCKQIAPDSSCEADCWKPAAFPSLTVNSGVAFRTINYGKYYTGNCDRRANSFTVFHSESTTAPQKTVIEIHGGGFTGGAMATSLTNRNRAQITAYVDAGFTYISLDYRLVATKYYFTDCSRTKREEEYIRVTANGLMDIPDEALPMSSYKIKVGRTEFITKCIYDAVEAMKFIASNALALKVDVNSIGFIAGSAGGALANYLIWSFPRHYPDVYKPISATFTSEQLDYPVQNTLDHVWQQFVDELGEGALLKDYLIESDCGTIVGNPWCTTQSTDQVNICNATWNSQTLASFCTSGFQTVSFVDLCRSQVWPNTTEQDRGLAYLWYTSLQMKLYRPQGFVLYVRNRDGGELGSKGWGAMAHHAIFAKQYGDLCNSLNIKCIIYYAPWLNIQQASRGIDVGGGLDLMETFSWRASAHGSTASAGSNEEMLQVHAYAAAQVTPQPMTIPTSAPTPAQATPRPMTIPTSAPTPAQLTPQPMTNLTSAPTPAQVTPQPMMIPTSAPTPLPRDGKGGRGHGSSVA